MFHLHGHGHGHRKMFYDRRAHHLIFSLFKKQKFEIIRITLSLVIIRFSHKFSPKFSYPFSCDIVDAALS